MDSYSDVLAKWSQTVKKFLDECNRQPPGTCLKVFYEQLVLQPNHTIRSIASFLQVPWSDSMLHHQDSVGKAISVSKYVTPLPKLASKLELFGASFQARKVN